MSGTDSTLGPSKNIMKMKFMQRGAEAEIREKQRQEREAMLKESHWVFDASADKATVLMEDSSVVSATSARRTFGNFSSKPKSTIVGTPTQPLKNEKNDKKGKSVAVKKQTQSTPKSQGQKDKQQKKRKRPDEVAASPDVKKPKLNAGKSSQKDSKQQKNRKEEIEDEDKMDEDSDASDQRMLDSILNADDDDDENVNGGISDEDASSMDEDDEE